MDICEKIILNPPFPRHHPGVERAILVGSKHRFLLRIFYEIYHLCQIDSLMTSIVGQPGSGKTQLLWHLFKLSMEGDFDGIVTIIDLDDQVTSTVDLLFEIVWSDTSSFLTIMNQEGISYEFPQKKPKNFIEREMFIKEIRRCIDLLRAGKRPNCGIVLAIDHIDEHVRQIGYDEACTSLLKTSRILLDDLDYLCIIFSLTDIVHDDVFEPAIVDLTHRRRYIVPHGFKDEMITLGEFTEQETYEMVAEFMRIWRQKYGINDGKEFPKNSNSIFGKFNLAPFTSKAVHLIWRASLIPGYISKICGECIQDKCYELTQDSNLELLITRKDAAKAIRKFHGELPNYDAVSRKISIILGKNEINQKIEKARKRLNEMYQKDQPETIVNFIISYISVLFSQEGNISRGMEYADFILSLLAYQNSPQVQIGFYYLDNPIISFRLAEIITDSLEAKLIDVAIIFWMKKKKNTTIQIENETISSSPISIPFIRGDSDYKSQIFSLPLEKSEIYAIESVTLVDESWRNICVDFNEQKLKLKHTLFSIRHSLQIAQKMKMRDEHMHP